MSNKIDKEIFEKVLESGARSFAKPKPSDRIGYGLAHGDKNLLAFARYIYPDFESPRHIRMIADKLTQIDSGKIKNLLINMPPRHGKSQFCTKIYPTWYLGRHPKDEQITASYSGDKAIEFTRWQRNTVESDRYHDIFPKIQTCEDSRAGRRWEITAGGVIVGAGVDGPITGRGAKLAIIDDPIKNYEEALSEVIQDKVWDWYCSTFLSRIYEDTAQIVIMTRWASDDLSGRLIEKDGLVENGGKWHLLKLPALDADGNALWPDKFSAEYLMSLRETMGEKIFMALYQQEPIDVTERLFDGPVFEEAPSGLRNRGFLDPAFGGSDSCALSVGNASSHDEDALFYLTGGYLWRSAIDETYNRVVAYCKKHNVEVLFVESNQAQVVIAHELRKRGLNVREVNSTTNKALRIQNYVKTNWKRIRFSKGIDPDFMKQLLTYSDIAPHDDAADSLAGIISQCVTHGRDLSKRFDISGLLFGRKR